MNTGNQKAQAKDAKNVVKFVGSVEKCIGKSVKAATKGKSFDVVTCEVTARSKYDTTAANIPGRPTCVDPTLLRVQAETFAVLHNIETYCASPSGAFLDGLK